jgi:hypothetical protein
MATTTKRKEIKVALRSQRMICEKAEIGAWLLMM